MSIRRTLLMTAVGFGLSASIAAADTTTITIATVNNGDMIRMQGLTDEFTAERNH